MALKGLMMKRLLAGTVIAGLVVAGLLIPGLREDRDMPRLDAASLEERLAGRDRITVPADQLVSGDHFLCVMGSYEARLPEGYEAAERELETAGSTPVTEGRGLLLFLDEGRRLEHVTSLSVWPDAVMLDVAEPLCLSASAARLDIRREDGSIVIRLE
jgi:hypothetical protein